MKEYKMKEMARELIDYREFFFKECDRKKSMIAIVDTIRELSEGKEHFGILNCELFKEVIKRYYNNENDKMYKIYYEVRKNNTNVIVEINTGYIKEKDLLTLCKRYQSWNCYVAIRKILPLNQKSLKKGA